MPRYSVLLLLALGACAGSQEEQQSTQAPPSEAAALGSLPATFQNTPSCAACLALTVTLRADGAYVARERLGASEFYDFGRWRESREAGMLHLSGGRDAPRTYAVRAGGELEAQAGAAGGDLERAAAVETLRGPFRLVGLFDGTRFKECQTGLAWPLDDSRAGQALKEQFSNRRDQAVLVSVDGRFEPAAGTNGRGEALRVIRTAAIHNQRGCPG